MRKLSFIILVLFVFSIPWQDVIYMPGGLPAISRILGVLLIFAAFLTVIEGNTLKIRRPSLMFMVTALFIFWAALSNFWGDRFGGSLFMILTYVQLGVMVWLIWQICRTKEQHLVLLQAFVLGAYILAGSTSYQGITNPFTPNSEALYERYTGIGGNANGIAGIMALGIPIAWHLSLVGQNGLLRLVNLIYIPTAVLGIIFAASRGGFIIAIIGLMLIPLTFSYANTSRKVIVSIALIVMCLAVARFTPEQNFNRILETSSEITEGNVSNRSQVWRAGLEVYSESPLLGVGVGNFTRATTPILGYTLPAHNAYVLILTELGAVGLIIFLSIFAVTTLPLLRLEFPERQFYFILTFALAVSIFPANDEDSQHVWALLAIMTTRYAYVMTFSHTIDTIRQSSSSVRNAITRRKRRLPAR